MSMASAKKTVQLEAKIYQIAPFLDFLKITPNLDHVSSSNDKLLPTITDQNNNYLCNTLIDLSIPIYDEAIMCTFGLVYRTHLS